jgi:hypothetical protein
MIWIGDMAMQAVHADPANPQIDEFWPNFKISMDVKDRDELQGHTPEGATERRIARDDEGKAR